MDLTTLEVLLLDAHREKNSVRNPAVGTETLFEGIEVRGAREHNLKSVSVKIPRDKITVVTGLSGSGKSSLAFDTIYAEGQRRYIESLSVYSRNFLEQMKKPDVDSITGLSPSIAIDQKSISSNPRSTVGTVTEIYDFLRLLFARVGTPLCPEHQVPVTSQSPEQIFQDVRRLPAGTKFLLLAPVAQGKKGEFLAEFQKWAKKGFVRARVDGKWIELAEAQKLAKHKSHTIDLLVDRLVIKPDMDHRLKESLNLALSMAEGRVVVETLDGTSKQYSLHSSCPVCGFTFPELEPRLFSFNNPKGACSTCNGIGTLDLSDGIEPAVESDDEADEVDEYALKQCPACHGTRLKKEALNVVIQGQNIAEMSRLPADDLRGFFKNIGLSDRQRLVGQKILEQIGDRLDYLCRVGTGYLSLDRPTRTLSGGEAQRIRLASQVGSSLIGVLYVLDEPSIGLHPRDHSRLLTLLREIRDRGNTILMVEHDDDTIRSADHLIDLGPRAGRLGGELIAEGTPRQVESNPKSVTGQYLSGAKQIELPRERRKGAGAKIELLGARANNLKNVNLQIPLGTLCGVTGVSGSGKSTLIVDTLFRILSRHFFSSSKEPAAYSGIKGLENLDKVIEINQKPIGRTPRSVPATYVGIFPLVRELFSQLPESKMRGYKPGHFSFNVKGGRCETCQGGGLRRIEMHFLSDVYVQCESCLGKRYSREILHIKYKGKNISDVLEMSIVEAEEFFRNHPTIHRKLSTLLQVGLDYMTLGQSSTTLSGGEAQRVKLSRELSRRGTGKTLYILDEPTTGLHFEDVKKLIHLLQALVDQGNTVLVIEHNLDVLKSCDHLIELGPEGGKHGGEILVEGSPEFLVDSPRSVTGPFLRPLVKPSQRGTSAAQNEKFL